MSWTYAMPFKGRHVILRQTDKLTGKQLLAIKSESLINVAINGDLPELSQLYSDLAGWSGSSEITNGLGSPNLVARDIESSPGVWWLKDQETSWEFLVFSDGWKKHPWKGSSIELISNTGEHHNLPQAVGRLVSCLAFTSTYYGSNSKIRTIITKYLGVRP